MNYTLYIDKKENFECQLQLQGASLRNAKARMIVENNDFNLMFEGKISRNGKCIIPISRMKGLLDEGMTGMMKLEVIAEDIYFQPWKSKFTVDIKQKLTVEVKSQIEKKKPKVMVSEVKNDPVGNLVQVFKQNNITIKEIIEKKKKIIPIIKEYHKRVNYKKTSKRFIKEVILKLTSQ